MKRWGKWCVLALAVVSASGLASRMVVSQQPDEAKPCLFADLIHHAQRHLEVALGGRLDFPPLCGLEFTPLCLPCTPQQMLRYPDADLEAHVRWHFPHLQGESLQRTLQAARQVAASVEVARYAEGHRIILVAPELLEKMAVWDPSLTGVKSLDFLQLTLVAEVVRWHLDQRYNLAKLRADCRDAEEFHALQAVVEGRVAYVVGAVAAKLGTSPLVPLLTQRFLHVPDDAPDPSLRAASQTYLHSRARACVQGGEFLQQLAGAGISEGLVYARRPRQMTMLARPEAWLRALEQRRPDLADVLHAHESALPAADWRPMQQTWTPAMLGQVAGLLGASKERVEKVAATWYEGRTLVWTKRDRPDLQVALSAVRHDSTAGARSHFGFALDLQRKQDTLPPGACGPSIRVVESKSTGVHLEGFDEAVRNDKRIQFGGGAALPVSLLLARAGDLVVECTWHGATADPALAEQLVRAVRTEAK